ncbi:MAG: CoA transferase [Dehalococcoidia bacterium]|nr:CoA transferase [Dehalococcoidia bacterium]
MPALTDVSVVEIATGVAGPYCGRLLADLGAQVIKVESGAGDPLRAAAPLVNGESAFFNYLNAGKLGVEAELGSRELDSLVRRADIVIHDLQGPAADALDADIRASNPRAGVIAVTPYGRSGPRHAWQSTPFTEWATGGFFFIAGDPAREPLALPGYQAAFHAGLQAGVATMAALWHSRQAGTGQVIEISHQEATLSDHCWLTTMWTHMGQVQKRAGSLYVPCADGWVFLFPLVPYPNLFLVMERFDLYEDESLHMPVNWLARFPEVFAAFSEWCATRTKDEIYHACQELRVAVSPVATMADVAASDQLTARDWFGTVAAGGKQFTAPGFPYKLMGTPCEQPGPAPSRGQHNGQALSPDFQWANTGVRPDGRSAGDGPLTGLRVLEMTANWAGPIAARHFADLGADVIKIELQTKPATRTLIAPNDDVWPDFFNRSAYFNKLNRNKRGMSLDVSKPRGKELFLELVKQADVVIENNAARVMGQLGLDYSVLSAANPAIVMCSLSGFGNTGPVRNYSAYGSNIETLSGLASLLGYDNRQFFGTGSFYADPVSGNHATVAVLAALHARRTSGKGQWIDMALLEAVESFLAQDFLRYTTSGVTPEPLGSQWGEGYLYQGTYPTLGKDCWLAVTVRDTADAAAVDRVTGGQGEPALREWALTQNHEAAANLLQAAGVPAAPVMQNWEIISDNHLNDRGFFMNIRHETAGTRPYPAFAWRFSETPATVRHAAPMFAEHNREVFRELLGVEGAAYEQLIAEGVTGEAPVFAAGAQL